MIGLPFGPGAYVRREGRLVRLDEQYRQCVVLIGTAPVGKANGEIDPWGTAFLIADNDVKHAYLVTAAHVLKDGLHESPVDVRFNKLLGGADILHIDEPEWFFHPTDDTVDVAVHPIEIPNWAACTQIPRSPNLNEKERFRRKDIGAGNRTYTVGLFKFLHGDRRNQPFVFSGHIGLVPEDQRIPVDGWLESHGDDAVLVEAYLVEGEPLDGASGSPVFVRRTLGPVPASPSGKLQYWVEGSVWLLGLMSDAFRAKPGRDYDIHGAGMIPRGVNVVVPASKIMEVMDHPELKKRRQAAQERDDKAKRPTKLSRAKRDNDARSEEETVRIRDEAVRRALNTPLRMSALRCATKAVNLAAGL